MRFISRGTLVQQSGNKIGEIERASNDAIGDAESVDRLAGRIGALGQWRS
jgi:hypothetical protein